MKKVLICSLLLLTLCLTGCGEEKQMDYSEGAKPLSLNEIYNSGAFGFYVKSGKDEFTPVINLETQRNALNGSYKWYTGHIKFPVVDNKHPLVAIFNTGNDMPKEYKVDRYDHICDTVGVNVRVGKDNQSLWFDPSNMLKGSNAESMLSDMGDEIEIDSIAGSDKKKVRPISNIDREINVFTGLKKDKYYTFTVYTGTQSLSADLCADTSVLKYRDEQEVTLKKTHDQYFIVNLPINLEAGYYDVNELGIFEIK